MEVVSDQFPFSQGRCRHMTACRGLHSSDAVLGKLFHRHLRASVTANKCLRSRIDLLNDPFKSLSMPLEQGSHLIYSANICAWQLNKSPLKWKVLGALLEEGEQRCQCSTLVLSWAWGSSTSGAKV